ncbi:MAG: phosphatase PAP2 family protein [Bacteroidota bacterium]
MKIIITSILLVFFITTTSTFSQSVDKINDSTIHITSKPIWIGKSLLEDQQHLWSSPFHIKKKDLYYIVPVALVAGTAMIFDENIHSHLMQFKTDHSWVKEISPVLTYGGEIPVVAGISAAFYIGGLVLKDDKIMQTGAIAGYALVNSAVVVSVLKMIAGRQRPRVDASSQWHPFPESLKQFTGSSPDKYASFPSGHSIAAFTLATVIAQQYKESIIIPVIMYSLATGVAISRTTENAHWLSDVIIGSALGYGIGKYMVQKHRQTKWVLFPSQSGGFLTITGIYRF